MIDGTEEFIGKVSHNESRLANDDSECYVTDENKWRKL